MLYKVLIRSHTHEQILCWRPKASALNEVGLNWNGEWCFSGNAILELLSNVVSQKIDLTDNNGYSIRKWQVLFPYEKLCCMSNTMCIVLLLQVNCVSYFNLCTSMHCSYLSSGHLSPNGRGSRLEHCPDHGGTQEDSTVYSWQCAGHLKTTVLWPTAIPTPLKAVQAVPKCLGSQRIVLN